MPATMILLPMKKDRALWKDDGYFACLSVTNSPTTENFAVYNFNRAV